MKRKFALFLLIILICFFVLPQNVFAIELEYTSAVPNALSDLFFGKNEKNSEQVYLCGFPVGITIDGEGVNVIGLNEFVSVEGVVSPAAESKIAIGDIIISIDGEKINNVAQLSEIANKSNGKPLKITLIRDGITQTVDITPKLDLLNKTYKLGIWARDSSSGIGTLTYIRKNMQFGALGHPIVDMKTGEIVNLTQGNIYPCQIVDVIPGAKGSAGELKGNFLLNNSIGTLYVNNKYGVYGNITALPNNFNAKLYSVAAPYEIKPGFAQILTTIKGDTPELFDIEIVRVYSQTSMSDKGLVIRVTDSRLLDVSGGIVQGMSGSPIIQNEMFVGAVTHVFINDPTKGYSIIGQWMLEN